MLTTGLKSVGCHAFSRKVLKTYCTMIQAGHQYTKHCCRRGEQFKCQTKFVSTFPSFQSLNCNMCLRNFLSHPGSGDRIGLMLPYHVFMLVRRHPHVQTTQSTLPLLGVLRLVEPEATKGVALHFFFQEPSGGASFSRAARIIKFEEYIHTGQILYYVVM